MHFEALEQTLRLRLVSGPVDKNFFCFGVSQKSASVVLVGIAVELEPRRPIFEKCSHLREKWGVLTFKTPVGFVLTYTVGLLGRGYRGRRKPHN